MEEVTGQKNVEGWSNSTLTGQGASIEIAKDNVPHDVENTVTVD